MAVVKGVGQLTDVLGRARFVEAAVFLLLQQFIHLTSGGELQNEVDPELRSTKLD